MSADMQAIYMIHPTMMGATYRHQYDINCNQISQHDYDDVVRKNENLRYNYGILKQRYALLVALVVVCIYYMILITMEGPMRKAMGNFKYSFANKPPTMTLNLSDLSGLPNLSGLSDLPKLSNLSESDLKLGSMIYTALSNGSASAIKAADLETESVTSEDTIKFAKSIKPTAVATDISATATATASTTSESTK